MAVPTHLEPAALFFTDLHPRSSISDTSCHFVSYSYPGICLHLSIAMNTFTGHDASMHVRRVMCWLHILITRLYMQSGVDSSDARDNVKL